MKSKSRWCTAAAVTAFLFANPKARALVSLEDGRDHVFVDGTVAGKPFVEVLPTTGQSGGGYGQLTPVINTSSAFTAAARSRARASITPLTPASASAPRAAASSTPSCRKDSRA